MSEVKTREATRTEKIIESIAGPAFLAAATGALIVDLARSAYAHARHREEPSSLLVRLVSGRDFAHE